MAAAYSAASVEVVGLRVDVGCWYATSSSGMLRSFPTERRGKGECLGDVGHDCADSMAPPAALLTLSMLGDVLGLEALDDWARRRECVVEALEGRRRNRPFVGSILQTPKRGKERAEKGKLDSMRQILRKSFISKSLKIK